MTGKTHVMVGTAGLLALSIKMGTSIDLSGININPYIGMVTVGVGSTLPDIDIQQSHMGHKYKFISKHLTHRGITHTLLIPALLTIIMWDFSFSVVLSSLVFGLLFGWVAHIAADMLNRKGVPVLWPLLSQKMHVMCIKTGKLSETIFCGVYLLAIGLWILM